MHKQTVTFIGFGSVGEPINGYLIRSKMIVERFSRASNMTVLEFFTRDQEFEQDGYTVRSFRTRHERSADMLWLKRLLSFNPLEIVYFQIESVRKLKKQRAQFEKSDEIIIEGSLLYMPMRYAKQFSGKLTLDTNCINSEVAQKIMQSSPIIGRLRFWVWKRLEMFTYNLADKLIFVSERDYQVAQELFDVDFKSKEIEIIENSVQKMDQRLLAPAVSELEKKFADFSSSILFIGDLGAIHNKPVAARMETYAQQYPETAFILIGNNPDELSSERGNVFFEGFVPEIDPYIVLADVCVAPLSEGSGTKTKVLDYLKYDKKILSTSVGAEGIDSDQITIVELDNFAQEIGAAL